MIVAIGTWVLNTACQQIAAWRRAGIDPVPVSVNLSSHQFRTRKLVQTVDRALKDSGIEPSLLELELTESTLMSDQANVVEDLAELRRRGLRISIDDFGTGYSSLSYLRKFPIDALKIDRSFIRDVTTDRDNAAITSAIVSMAKALNLRVIAEGVETQEQLEFLRQLGCEEMQGFLVSRPLPAEEATAFLREYLDSQG